jgi:hypothetical protein
VFAVPPDLPSGSQLPLAEELATVFARMAGLLLTRETVETVLGLITALALETVAGADGAGVTLLDERGRRTTSAATDPLVERADLLQYEYDQGPCLAAAVGRQMVGPPPGGPRGGARAGRPPPPRWGSARRSALPWSPVTAPWAR